MTNGAVLLDVGLAAQGYHVVNVTGGIDRWSVSHDSDIPRYV